MRNQSLNVIVALLFTYGDALKLNIMQQQSVNIEHIADVPSMDAYAPTSD